MTPEEAVQVAGAALLADGGCHHCTAQVLGGLRRSFPDIDWVEAVVAADKEEDYAEMFGQSARDYWAKALAD